MAKHTNTKEKHATKHSKPIFPNLPLKGKSGFLLIVVALFTFSLASSAQEIGIDSEAKSPDKLNDVLNRQNTFKVLVHTQGFGIGYKHQKIKNIYITQGVDFELVSLASLKQIKIVNTYDYSAKPFVYGKINNVFVMRGGFNRETRIYRKPYWGGVELRWLLEYGVSLAIQKPYYYNVVIDEANDAGEYVESTTYQTFDKHLEWISINGRAPFSQGIIEIEPSVGLHLKTGLSFDFGKSRLRAQSIEIGGTLDCFPTGITIMDSERDKRLFLTFFLAYSWGNRFVHYGNSDLKLNKAL